MQTEGMVFFERDSLRARIEKRIDAFLRGYRQNIGLIGPEGTGKTTLLGAIHRSLASREELCAAYVPSTGLTLAQFCENWISGLLSGLLPQSTFEASPGQDFFAPLASRIPRTLEKIRGLRKLLRLEKNAQALKELFALSGILGEETRRKVILMMDEFHGIAGLPVSDPFGLLGREIMVQKNTLYLVSSSCPAKAREIFHEKLSLLFGNFEMVDMPWFGFEEAADFLKSRLPNRRLSGAQTRFFIQMTDGSPLALELLCERLLGVFASPAEDTVFLKSGESFSDGELLEAFTSELFNERGRLYLLFAKRLETCERFAKDSAPYRRALVAVSQGRRKAPGVAAAIEKKLAETVKILQRLTQEEGLIVRQGTFYTLADPLFGFWLREVYGRALTVSAPDGEGRRAMVRAALERELLKESGYEPGRLPGILEKLFQAFRHEIFEWEEKKWRLSHFSDVMTRPLTAASFLLTAKNARERWFCQASLARMGEEDVAAFLEELGRARKKSGKRILIALGGIEQNAKLMAQEAEIQIWNLRTVNRLFDLYDLPKWIVLSEREEHGPALGALAQNVHSA